MALFNRQTMDQITQKMIDWTRGATSSLTDFRDGSKTRSIYEAVGIVLEDYYDRTFKALKLAIQQNLYTTLGFTALPAVNATGTVRFYAQNPPANNAPFLIPSGTQVQTNPTGTSAPVTFQTTNDAYLYYNSPTEAGSVLVQGNSVQGWYYVDVPVACVTAGTIGNVSSNTIQTMVGSPSGIGAVNNGSAFTTGQEAETVSQQKARFQLFMQARVRGTIESIQYGATTATVMDPTNTYVQERVQSAIVNDGAGSFTVYLWNGTGTASSDLIAEATKIITGYTDPTAGTRVWGYKPAGSSFTVYSVTPVNVPLAMTVTPLTGYGVTDSDVSAGNIDLRTSITNAISAYFATIQPGQTVLWSALEASVKSVTGVYDVQLTAPTANVTTDSTSILVPQFPITFTKGTTV